MRFSPVPKTLLLLVLLSVIAHTRAHAAELQLYRFGGWMLVAPAALSPQALESGAVTLPVPAGGIEFLAYWQDGRERALALRFASDGKLDAAVMSSFGRGRQLKGCKLGNSARLKPMKQVLPRERPKDADIPAFPDDATLVLAGSERRLTRAGDVLVADLGSARVQIADDSPIVRLGEWGSADFCRFELIRNTDEDEE